MDIVQVLQEELKIKKGQVENTIKLIQEGNTIPFIARYRKELTGGLNDEVLRQFGERFAYLQNLEARKEQVTKSIEEQGKMTEELKAAIEKATTATEVEDLYLPYRPKKRTRATIAKEKGLEELARAIRNQKEKHIEALAESFIAEEKGVSTVEEALAGAKDILAEEISDEASLRGAIRKFTFQKGLLVSKAKDEKEKTVYDMYYDYSEKLSTIPGHRILAINRGEKEKALSVKIEAPIDEILTYMDKKVIYKESTTRALLEEVLQDSYKRLIAPAVERDIRSELSEKAEEGALEVFKKNLYQLLMQAPIKGHNVMGVDPAYRTGCKIAVVDSTGKKLAKTVVFPTPPQNKTEEAKETLKKLIEGYNVDLLSIGNGTASRETEKFVAEMLKEIPRPIHYVIVNEAGASVYSASKLATEEFPHDDVGVRSAVSIARRLQDPLAELVKIDPKAIGVGQYQHDMNQKRLEESLGGVVEGAVNEVGVDINTASASLLQYVAGIKKTVSQNIVAYREEVGKFSSRAEIKKVKGLGPKVFEQCAGFLRITDGKNFLDATGVHPESYEVAKSLIEKCGYTKEDLKKRQFTGISQKIDDVEKLAKELDTGVPTLQDIIKELEKPGRDPREDMPKPILHSEVLEMKDLKVGMKLKGTVRNIVDFGAFVDIGVHQDGLVHLSQMSHKFIKHPLEVVKVGDIVEVSILSVDMEKNKIALSMKQ
ncbi:RNA-binding transcriptional accessory protein [Sporanaerobium hydrogeniformans]|uniref:RNA-binding transcriptional accessory protein n=1 Tax=Sporanaerobium hydrogeniformans TaxID=3072179 RepID=A0AC61DHF1_9FIRM|nr:Tex family protein [Sporanaerobium hydrogeniformans]PHV72021.1 RNA-binding transcriptional accessory protein [Sporanaerobium hydrogeniformans]